MRYRSVGVSGYSCGPSSNFGCQGFSGIRAFSVDPNDIGSGDAELDRLQDAGYSPTNKNDGIPSTGVTRGGSSILASALSQAAESAVKIGNDSLLKRFGVRTAVNTPKPQPKAPVMNTTTIVMLAVAAAGVLFLVMKRR